MECDAFAQFDVVDAVFIVPGFKQNALRNKVFVWLYSGFHDLPGWTAGGEVELLRVHAVAVFFHRNAQLLDVFRVHCGDTGNQSRKRRYQNAADAK